MNLKVEDHKIMLEFPLTQPKRAWKIRKRGGRKTSPKFKYLIQEGDVFEWMITNEEVRDMASVLRCISPQEYQGAKRFVNSISSFNSSFEEKIGAGITLEASSLPKQRKRDEFTPYLFVLVALDRVTDEYYLVDKRGGRIEETLRYQLKSGDKLIWIIKPLQIKNIIVSLASLDRRHQEMVKTEVFEILNNNRILW